MPVEHHVTVGSARNGCAMPLEHGGLTALPAATVVDPATLPVFNGA